jgi:hypothetical protein
MESAASLDAMKLRKIVSPQHCSDRQRAGDQVHVAVAVKVHV